MKYLGLTDAMKWNDINPDILAIPDVARSGMIYLFERLMVANQSNLHRWWYIRDGAEVGIYSGLQHQGNWLRMTFGGGIIKISKLALPRRKISHQPIPQGISSQKLTSICYTPLARHRLVDFLRKRGLWGTMVSRNAFHHGILNRLARHLTNLEIYLRLNSLLYGNSLSTFLDRNSSLLKTSGTTTPAPTSKVLRWKDLEAAAAEVEKLREEFNESNGQSVFGTEDGQRDALSRDDSWEEEGINDEELFVWVLFSFAWWISVYE
jgi:hypothetical protein